MIQRAWKAMSTSRLPHVAAGVVVMEVDGSLCRGLTFERGDASARVVGPLIHGDCSSVEGLRYLVERLRPPHRSALLVIPEASATTALRERRWDVPGTNPTVLASAEGSEEIVEGWAADASGPDEDRYLIAKIARRQRDAWRERLDRLGLRLEGIYPVVGTPLAGIEAQDERQPRLVLQLEREVSVWIEAIGSTCLAMETRHGSPSIQHARDLLGVDCPEVTLCGRGVNLSEFGYRLVRSTRTWVRLPKLRTAGGHEDLSIASLLGAANHAFGFVPPAATACVPPC